MVDDADDSADALRRWASVLVVVAVNLVPVAFLAAGSWQPGDVLIAYWLENLVVGAFGVAKILTARGTPVAGSGTFTLTRTVGGRTTSVEQSQSAGGRLALAGFFVMHFGIFTLVHGVFTGLLAWSIGVSGSVREWGLMVLALFLSHGLSLWLHWIRGGERDRVSPSQAMLGPYGRIVVLHLVVIGSFFFVARGLDGFGGAGDGASGERFVPALALIAVKTAVDVATHVREHRTRDRIPET